MEKIKPLCPYFGTCGGCSAQHIASTLQLENKKKWLQQELVRNNVPVPVITLSSGDPYYYRNRMEFLVSSLGLGLRDKDNANKIIPIEQCALSNKKINVFLNEVNQWFDTHRSKLEPFNAQKMSGTLKYIVIRAAEYTLSTTISFIVNENSMQLAQHINHIREFAVTSTAKNVLVGRIPAKTDESFSYDCFVVKGTVVMDELLCGKNISFFSQSFFQNNTYVAEKMVTHCLEIFKRYSPKNGTLIDLYGGAGTFGVSLGHLFKNVIILDHEGPNGDCARKNLQTNSLSGSVVVGDAAALAKVLFSGPLYMITDPPRIGMEHKVIKTILTLKPDVLVYVSCNPKQLAKELKQFMPQYNLSSLVLCDFFPQTPHTEVIAELVHK